MEDKFNDFSKINKIYFEHLIEQNINLQLIKMQANTFLYENIVYDISEINLSLLKPVVFTYNCKDFISIIDFIIKIKEYEKNISIIERNMKLYLSSVNIDDQIIKFINDLVDNYFKLFELKQYYDLDFIAKKFEYLLSLRFNDTYINKPVSNYIESKINEKWNIDISNSGNENAVVRIKNTGSGTSTIKEPQNNIAGFANTTILVSLTIILGIILAVFGLYFGLK